MTTPALLIIPLVHFVGRKLDNPRVKTILQTVVIASAGLLLAAVIPLARDALTDWLTDWLSFAPPTCRMPLGQASGFPRAGISW
jgi:chromate transport protein ChrA